LTLQQKSGIALAIVGLAAIAALTLTPEAGAPTMPPSLCLVCGSYGVQDIILNVVLFIPYGAGLRASGMRWWHALALAAATSIVIELLQVDVIAGRDASLGDVITNTIGGGLGILLADTWRSWVQPRARHARWLAWGSVAVWVAVALATVWGERRSLPHTRYWGGWPPQWIHLDPFPGKLIAASVAGIPYPDAVDYTNPEFRPSFLADTMLATATVIPGRPPERMASILNIYDIHRSQILLLGQRGRDLVFFRRANADAARFRSPGIVLRDVFPASASAADTLHIVASVTRSELVLRAWHTTGGRETERVRRIALGPGLGWSNLLPFAYAYDAWVPVLTVLWLLALFAVIGFWGAQSGRPAEMAIALVVAVVIGLTLVPSLAGGHRGAWWEWSAALAGAGLGWWLGGRARHGARRRGGTSAAPSLVSRDEAPALRTIEG
jgi:hypothetical protein